MPTEISVLKPSAAQQIVTDAQTARDQSQGFSQASDNARAASVTAQGLAEDARDLSETYAGIVSRATTVAGLTDPTTLTIGDFGYVSGSGDDAVDGLYEVQDDTGNVWVRVGDTGLAGKADKSVVDNLLGNPLLDYRGTDNPAEGTDTSGGSGVILAATPFSKDTPISGFEFWSADTGTAFIHLVRPATTAAEGVAYTRITKRPVAVTAGLNTVNFTDDEKIAAQVGDIAGFSGIGTMRRASNTADFLYYSVADEGSGTLPSTQTTHQFQWRLILENQFSEDSALGRAVAALGENLSAEVVSARLSKPSLRSSIVSIRNRSNLAMTLATGRGVLVIGVPWQSNSIGRATFDGGANVPSGTLQWGRVGADNGQIIAATELLQHTGAISGHMGFHVQFAIDFGAVYPDIQLLFVPVAVGGTGFISNRWNRGDDLYTDCVNRINACLDANPDFAFAGLIGQIGENDGTEGNADFAADLDAAILGMRQDIHVADEATPFVLGELLSSWVGADADRLLVNNAILNAPNRLRNVAVSSSTSPTVLTGVDSVHFNAAGLRAFGSRSYLAWESALVRQVYL